MRVKIDFELSRKKLLAISAVILVACAFLCYAAYVVLYVTPTTHHALIMDDGVVLWNNTANTAIFNVDWGRVAVGSETSMLFSVKNNAQSSIMVEWNASSLPYGITLSAEYWDAGVGTSGEWVGWPMNAPCGPMLTNPSVGSNNVRFDLIVPLNLSLVNTAIDWTVNILGATE